MNYYVETWHLINKKADSRRKISYEEAVELFKKNRQPLDKWTKEERCVNRKKIGAEVVLTCVVKSFCEYDCYEGEES